MNSYSHRLLKLSWGLIFSFFISFTAISGDNSTRKENLPVQLHLASFDIDVTPLLAMSWRTVRQSNPGIWVYVPKESCCQEPGSPLYWSR